MNELLREVLEKSSKQNKMSEEDFNTPLDEFIMMAYRNCYPNTYGILFAKKVIQLSNGGMKQMNPKLDCGDAQFSMSGQRKYCEIKISYLNEGGKYRITNIRTHQNFNFFILCFVDKIKNFKPNFYVVPKEAITNNPAIHLTPMNGTSWANMNNEIVPMSTTINAFDLDWLLKKHNVLTNTSTKSLLTYLSKIDKQTMGLSMGYQSTINYNPPAPIATKSRKPIVKISFSVYNKNGKYYGDICESSNRKSVVELVKILGPRRIAHGFWPAWLNTTKNEFRTVDVGDGYYLHPKMSFRDIQKIIKSLNRLTQFHIEISTK